MKRYVREALEMTGCAVGAYYITYGIIMGLFWLGKNRQ